MEPEQPPASPRRGALLGRSGRAPRSGSTSLCDLVRTVALTGPRAVFSRFGAERESGERALAAVARLPVATRLSPSISPRASAFENARRRQDWRSSGALGEETAHLAKRYDEEHREGEV